MIAKVCVSVYGVDFFFILFLAFTSLAKARGHSNSYLIKSLLRGKGNEFMLAAGKFCNETIKVMLT